MHYHCRLYHVFWEVGNESQCKAFFKKGFSFLHYSSCKSRLYLYNLKVLRTTHRNALPLLKKFLPLHRNVIPFIQPKFKKLFTLRLGMGYLSIKIKYLSRTQVSSIFQKETPFHFQGCARHLPSHTECNSYRKSFYKLLSKMYIPRCNIWIR